jgi:hypothetical protein
VGFNEFTSDVKAEAKIPFSKPLWDRQGGADLSRLSKEFLESCDLGEDRAKLEADINE